MVTYQDLLEVSEARDSVRAEFVRSIIHDRKQSVAYKTAKIADDYNRNRNTTIMNYQKTITTVTGEIIPDRYSATHRSTSNFFQIFTTQLNQYLLGNGANFGKSDTKDKLGVDFDVRLQEAGKDALCGGCSFGFWNLDHLEVYSMLEFAPLYDEENGALAAGVRFWQIDSTRPLRATLMEMDGYTNYLWSTTFTPSDQWTRIDDGVYMIPKRPYIQKIQESEADGTEIYDGENYEAFPVVPLWGNPMHQSEIIGLREKIDAYDFILNGFEDDLDNAQLYWIIQGAGGMDDPDLMQFLERLKTVRAAAPADGQSISPVQVEIPHDARERLLDRLEKVMYRDAMIMNPDDIAGGAATATQIRAAYERQNVKADQYEYCVLDFLYGIMKIAGIDDKPTFDRSLIVNTQEEIQTIVASASYLPKEYVTKKILSLLGDADKVEEVMTQIDGEDAERLDFGADMNG